MKKAKKKTKTKKAAVAEMVYAVTFLVKVQDNGADIEDDIAAGEAIEELVSEVVDNVIQEHRDYIPVTAVRVVDAVQFRARRHGRDFDVDA